MVKSGRNGKKLKIKIQRSLLNRGQFQGWQDNVLLMWWHHDKCRLVAEAPILKAVHQQNVVKGLFRNLQGYVVSLTITYWEKLHSNSPATPTEMSSIIYSFPSRIVIRALRSPGSCLLGCNLPISINTPINSNGRYLKIQILWDVHTEGKKILVNKHVCLCLSFAHVNV